jgi:hypothetical protein
MHLGSEKGFEILLNEQKKQKMMRNFNERTKEAEYDAKLY